jgi:chromosome condensin MukBEF ATPase and DNA-binding subunit MukB
MKSKRIFKSKKATKKFVERLFKKAEKLAEKEGELSLEELQYFERIHDIIGYFIGDHIGLILQHSLVSHRLDIRIRRKQAERREEAKKDKVVSIDKWRV